MVFKILRAGRKMKAVKKILEDESELDKYAEKYEENLKKHSLSEDIEIMDRHIDWMRFSKEGSEFLRELGKEPEPVPVSEEKIRENLPVATVMELVSDTGKWENSHVIMDGTLEFLSDGDNGEKRHVFRDSTGSMAAFSGSRHEGSGTLFATAGNTKMGKQTFLRIMNFHPSED